MTDEKKRLAALKSNEKWKDPETHKKRVEGIKKSYTPELRRRRSEDTKKQFQNEESRTLQSEMLINHWQSVSEEEKKELGKKISDSLLSPAKKNKKLTLLEANGKCTRCHRRVGKECKQLVIHHINGYQFDNEKDNLVALCEKCHGAVHTNMGRERGRFFGKATVANHLAYAMKNLGLDLNDPNLRETPERVARLWEEFAAPNRERTDRIKYIMSRKFPSEYKDMVICHNIKAPSICPHHFSHISYTIHFAYIPDKYVLGLSKIVDVIKNVCKAPKLQEDLGDEIVDMFMKELEPLGCMCIINGIHSCMTMRDVEARESSTITSSCRGEFLKPTPGKGDPRQEFLSLLRLGEIK